MTQETENDPNTLTALVYVENHPDRHVTFLGVFTSREKAETARDLHLRMEQARLPGARISEYDYSFYEGILDLDTWWSA